MWKADFCKSCCVYTPLFSGKGECWIGVIFGRDCIQGPGFECWPVTFPSPPAISSIHLEVMQEMSSPYGSPRNDITIWEVSAWLLSTESSPFPSTCLLKPLSIFIASGGRCCQMGAGHRLVKWALNSSVLVSWDSLGLLHFSSLFCPRKSGVGKGCGFPPPGGCRADLSGVWCHGPQSKCTLRMPYFGLAVDSGFGTPLVQITFYQLLNIASYTEV